MKYLLMSLLVVIGIVSCQKEITDEVPGGVDTTVVRPPANFEADIDSVHWVANTMVKAEYVGADSFGTPPLLIITASSSNGRTLTIGVLDSVVRTHVYDIYAIDSVITNGVSYSDSSSAAKGTFYSNDSLFARGIKVGTMAVTGFDTSLKIISGTFSFKVARTKDSSYRSFANGTFSNVPYTQTASYIAPAAEDTFHVKIKDTLFSAYQVSVSNASGSITVTGSDSLNKQQVALVFADTIHIGTYTFKTTSPSGIYTFNSTKIYLAPNNTGVLQILENNTVNKRVRANFSFTGATILPPADSAKLTEGYFSVEKP